METIYLSEQKCEYFFSLNRTMQYGNEETQEKDGRKIWFKSYYVVWKPKNPVLTAIGMYGLNRTMQYGNFEAL